MAEKKNRYVVLAIDTSGRAGSIALGFDGNIMAEKPLDGDMRHNAELFTAIKALLEHVNKLPSDIGYIYVSMGPGSFTGLRIAVTMAKMLAITNNAKIVAVNTTDALALNADQYTANTGENVENVGTIIDAKRKQFFVALFKKETDGWKKIISDSIMKASEFVNLIDDISKPVHLLGEGLLYYKDSFNAPNIHILPQEYWPTQAGNIYRIGYKMAVNGQFTDPTALLPLYLRRPEAVENWEKRNPTDKTVQ